MQEYLKKFSINDVQMYREQEEDMDFSIVEIWALAEGQNSHRNPFSREVLEKYANTFKGKFIVAKFDKWTKDTEGHELDETIVGYVNPNEPIEFKTKVVDNVEKEFVVVKGLLSKIYATEIIEMFRLNNNRTVSCEFSCSTMYEENEQGRPIDEYGKELNIDNPILKYHIHGITILGLKYNPSVRGTEIKVKQFAQTCDNITLKERAEQRLKNINKKEFSKEDLLYKEKDKEDIMEEEKKLSESVTDKEEKDVVMEEAVEEKEMAQNETENADNAEEKEMAEAEDKEVVEEQEKEMAETEEQPIEEEKEMGCDKAMEEETEKDTDQEEEKKFSLDAYVDVLATVAMLEKETEDNKELADKVLKEMSADEILTTVLSFAKENAELKKFKAERETNDRDMKLSAIMASVKEDLDAKKFSELQEEGKTLSYEELSTFENKVKAFAYEASKNKEKDADSEIMKFAGVTVQQNAELSADDIYKKYL